MVAFEDFTPMSGGRIVVTNHQKFLFLPEKVQEYVQDYFKTIEKSPEQSIAEAEAILQELQGLSG